jgi:hypothetical protein
VAAAAEVAAGGDVLGFDRRISSIEKEVGARDEASATRPASIFITGITAASDAQMLYSGHFLSATVN